MEAWRVCGALTVSPLTPTANNSNQQKVTLPNVHVRARACVAVCALAATRG